MKFTTRIFEKLMTAKKSRLNITDPDNINNAKNKKEISKDEVAFDLLETYRQTRTDCLSKLSIPNNSVSKTIETMDNGNTLNTGEVIMLWWCDGRIIKSNQSFPKYFSKIYNLDPFKTLNKLETLQLIYTHHNKYALSSHGKNILAAHPATISNHKDNIYLSEADNNKLHVYMTATNINLIDKGTLLLMTAVDKTDPNIRMLSQTIEELQHSKSHNFICPLQKIDSELVKYLDDSWHRKIAILNEVNTAESKQEKVALYKKISKRPDLTISDIKFKFNIHHDTDENRQIFLLSKELTKEKHYDESNKFTLWAMHDGYQRSETWLRLAINYRYLKDLNSEENALKTGILWCKQCNEDDKKLTERLDRVHELMTQTSI